MEERKEIKALETQALTMPERAKQIQIIDDESLHKGNEFMHACRQLEKKIDGTMDPLIKKANDLHRDTLATKREMKDPVTRAKNLVDPKIISYKHKVEEEIRLREEEKEQKIEEEKKKKEEALLKAVEAEKVGDHEKAAEELEKAEESEEEETTLALEPKFKAVAPATKGTTTMRYWKFRLKDLSKVPRKYLKLNEVKVGADVRGSNGKIEIPGIENYYIESSTLRS